MVQLPQETSDVSFQAPGWFAVRCSPLAVRWQLHSTLSPCDMCSGAALLYGIPKIVVGENRTFQSPETYVRSRGVEVVVVDDARCREMMERFVREKPALWGGYWGVGREVEC